jgi:putative transposase
MEKGARQAHTTSKSANRLPRAASEPQIAAPLAALTFEADELSEFEVESMDVEVNHER